MANKLQRCLRQLLMTALLCAAWPAAAQCLAPLMPDDGDAYAYSPFGVSRVAKKGGASGGWHMGIDIQKPVNSGGGGRKITPLSAPITGTVIAIPNGQWRGAGNTMIFRRPDGLEVQYMHMDSFADKFRGAKGVPVTAGEFVGMMGSTGGNYGIHLHLGTKIPTNAAGNYRDKLFASASKNTKTNLPFTADMLAAGHKVKASMLFADPQYWLNRQYRWETSAMNLSHYKKQGFQMAPGNKTFPPTCPALGSFDYSKMAQQQAVQAVGGEDPATMTPEQMETSTIFQDGDRVGIVDAPPFESYADLSERELIRVEAGRRMTDAGWDHQVAESSVRGLTIELARIRAAELFIRQRLEEKKKRVEALMAALLAQRTRNVTAAQ